jgi:hypothetical protein
MAIVAWQFARPLNCNDWTTIMIKFLKGIFTGNKMLSGEIATQPNGEVFPFPNTVKLMAIDELVISLPIQLIGNGKIGDAVVCDDNAEICIPKTGEVFFVKLKPGMLISVVKSCQAAVISEDNSAKRIRVIR